MMVGLPGTGIGGLFYVLSSLGAPIRVWRARRTGGPGAGAPAGGLALMGAAVFGAVWATGWALGLLLARPLTRTLTVLGVARGGAPPPSLIRNVSLLLAVATLVAVLAAVEVARLVVRGRRGAGEPAGSIAPHAAASLGRQDAA
jgi:hypothetical protein